MTQMYFSQFWKLQVQKQGIIKAGFILGLFWVYRWLLSHCVFIWALLNVHLEKGGVFWCLLQVLHSHDLIKPSYLSKAPPPSPSHWWLEFPHMNLGGDKMFIPSGQSFPVGQRINLVSWWLVSWRRGVMIWRPPRPPGWFYRGRNKNSCSWAVSYIV